MSDALCGPSNALQSFQKHAQVDRTLQQDRLTGPRQSPGQGFRTPDPRSGSLDADFNAFENAQHGPFMFNESSPLRSFHNDFALSRPVVPEPAAAWASDFQQLHSTEQPVSVHQFRTEAPLIRSAPGGWQQDFMRQRQNGGSPVALGKQPVYEQYHGQMSPLAQQPIYSSLQQQNTMVTARYAGDVQQTDHADVQQGLEHLSMTDWSNAFDQAIKDASSVEHTTMQRDEQILHNDGTYTNDRSQMDVRPALQEQENIRIGSDAIDYKEMADRTADQNAQDASALARVAGELLHNVQHETNDKFQNSQFLNLMRKIRDRQVEIRDNDFQSTEGESLTSAQKTQPAANRTEEQPSGFTFPDMDAVFAPNPDLVDYSFDSDQFPSEQGPRSQIQDLHPGGRLYPGTPDQQSPRMSGGVRPLEMLGMNNFVDQQGPINRDQNPALQERSTMA